MSPESKERMYNNWAILAFVIIMVILLPGWWALLPLILLHLMD